MSNFRILVLLFLALLAPSAWAAPADHGILVREAFLYLAPDATSAKMGNVARGREVAILEKSREWLHVFANVDVGKEVTGWILDKGVVRASTPNGDRILFGEAVDSEAEASRRRGRRGAAQDAMRLYTQAAEYFPHSPIAGEALYRSADIRWQLDREEVMSRPSAKERDPMMRPEIDEEHMTQVMKKFPHSKWSDLAAYALIDNKLCGTWEGRSSCPEKEAGIYEKYATEHPESPKAAEALYEAAWRRSALIEIYKTESQMGRAREAKSRATALAQSIIQKYPQTDWAARAYRLVFLVEQDLPTHGNTIQ